MIDLIDPDTDRDGLTDWWETVTDQKINPYGSTDPLNRDSDNDGAIDGGESNVYPSTSIDIDGDGVVDSGKQIDLNGDGIIEMGEENYYETPPDKVTYFLDIFAVADQEYVDYYDRFVEGNYKRIIQISIDGADEYFMKQFDIKLNVVEIWHDWNSDDASDTHIMSNLLEDVKLEYNWESNKRNTDALIAFTGKDPNFEGMADPNPSNLSVIVQIPELSDPRVLEFNENLKFLGIFNAWVQYEWNQRLIQHEVSHLFGAYDYGMESPNYHQQDNITGIRLARIHSIMDKTRYSEDKEGFKADKTGNIWLCNEWNEESILVMNSNKASITNGSYQKYISYGMMTI